MKFYSIIIIILLLIIINLKISNYNQLDYNQLDYNKDLNQYELDELRNVFSIITDNNNNNNSKNDIIQSLINRKIWKYFYQRPTNYTPNLKALPIWNTNYFDFVKKLENNFKLIENEINEIDTDPKKKNLITNVNEDIYQGEWKDLFFYNNGARNNIACKAFPNIARIIDSIKELQGVNPGCVCLSFIYPGTSVSPHFGISNNKLRLHLGIKNLDDSTLYVKDKSFDKNTNILKLKWKKGKAFIFDDSFEHWVENKSTGNKPRIILLADLWHPDLTNTQIYNMKNDQNKFRSKYPFLNNLVENHHIKTVNRSNNIITVNLNKNMQNEISKYLIKTGLKHFSHNSLNNTFRVTYQNGDQEIIN